MDGEYEEYAMDCVVASLSILLNQTPSAIKKERMRDLEMVQLMKEVENKKMEMETDSSKREIKWQKTS